MAVSVNADKSITSDFTALKVFDRLRRHTHVKLQSNVETSVCSGLLKEEMKMKARWNVRRERVREGVGECLCVCESLSVSGLNQEKPWVCGDIMAGLVLSSDL